MCKVLPNRFSSGLTAVFMMAALVLAGCDSGGITAEKGGSKGGGLLGGALTNNSTPPPNFALLDATNITSNRTLSADTTYLLSGIVEVKEDGSLTIPAGTFVFGNANIEPTALIVRKGGDLFVNGTEANPVIFSAADAALDADGDGEGEYSVTFPATIDGQSVHPADNSTAEPGDWGGIVIIGSGPCNGTGDPNAIEGPANEGDCEVRGLITDLSDLEGGLTARDEQRNVRIPFGGGNDADDSGSISYARIEYAGFDLVGSADPQNSGDELNALTLYSVGRSTQIDHVQVHEGLDDGVQLYGGAVNLKYIYATGIDDDAIDYSYGWEGDAQFIIAQQYPSDGNHAFEVDNNEAESGETTDYDFDNPYTNPRVYNVTLVSLSGGDNTGIKYRRGAAGELRNFIGQGFEDLAIDIDHGATEDRCNVQRNLSLDNSIFYDTAGSDLLTCAQEFTFDNVDPELANPFDTDNPDFRPNSDGSDMDDPATGGATEPGGFISVSYIGAVDPSVSASGTWYDGWTRGETVLFTSL